MTTSSAAAEADVEADGDGDNDGGASAAASASGVAKSGDAPATIPGIREMIARGPWPQRLMG